MKVWILYGWVWSNQVRHCLIDSLLHFTKIFYSCICSYRPKLLYTTWRYTFDHAVVSLIWLRNMQRSHAIQSIPGIPVRNFEFYIVLNWIYLSSLWMIFFLIFHCYLFMPIFKMEWFGLSMNINMKYEFILSELV